MMIWHGLNVDWWGPIQTIEGMPTTPAFAVFNYGDPIWIENRWWHIVEPIPLEIRFASFKRRLAKALREKGI